MRLRHVVYLWLVLSASTPLLLTCTKDPASPDKQRDELAPRGSVAGYVYNHFGSPLRGVTVTAGADSATASVSDENGFFTVGQMLAGDHTLRFLHDDYEEKTLTVSLETGVDDTLTDSIRLSYRYYVMKGRAVDEASEAVLMAGVVIAGTGYSTLTDDKGEYLFPRVEKAGPYRLVLAKSGVGTRVMRNVRGVDDDTTFLADAVLDGEGGTVSGIVVAETDAPLAGVAVTALEGAVADTTDSTGTFTLRNFPAREEKLTVTVTSEKTGLETMLIGLDVAERDTLAGLHIRLLEDTKFTNGMSLEDAILSVDEPVDSVTVTVVAHTRGDTAIEAYRWFGDGDLLDTTGGAVVRLAVGDLPVDSVSGACTLSVVATSAEGLVSDTAIIALTLPVVEPNAAPSLTDSTASMSATIEAGATYRDTVDATDDDGDTLRYSFIDSAAGMQLDGNVLVWNPDEADEGEHTVAVAVSDGRDTVTLTWTVTVALPTILYVKEDAAGTANGDSWRNAYTDLQSAIDAAASGTEVWVAGGTYTPTVKYGGTDERNRSFRMKYGVSIYGGFSGKETSRSQRDPRTIETVLSGDVGIAGDSSDNVYHVIYNTADLMIRNDVVIDGFTIEGGYANGQDPHDRGGGIYNDAASPVLSNCIVRDNYAAAGGGGIALMGRCESNLVGCTIVGNVAEGSGGGVFCGDHANVTFISCVIDSNLARIDHGGGMWCGECTVRMDSCAFSWNESGNHGGGLGVGTLSAEVTRCVFRHNRNNLRNYNGDVGFGGGVYSNGTLLLESCLLEQNTAYKGAGVGCYGSTSMTAVMNCVIVSNSAGTCGGAVFAERARPLLLNTTVTGNSSRNGGGLCLSSYGGGAVVVNCILWGNTATGGSHEISGTATLGYCIVGDTTLASATVWTDDPLLTPLDDYGGAIPTIGIEKAGSALDSGVYAYVDADWMPFISEGAGGPYRMLDGTPYTPQTTPQLVNATDARGVTRPRGAGIDIGAYERE